MMSCHCASVIVFVPRDGTGRCPSQVLPFIRFTSFQFLESDTLQNSIVEDADCYVAYREMEQMKEEGYVFSTTRPTHLDSNSLILVCSLTDSERSVPVLPNLMLHVHDTYPSCSPGCSLAKADQTKSLHQTLWRKFLDGLLLLCPAPYRITSILRLWRELVLQHFPVSQHCYHGDNDIEKLVIEGLSADTNIHIDEQRALVCVLKCLCNTNIHIDEQRALVSVLKCLCNAVSFSYSGVGMQEE